MLTRDELKKIATKMAKSDEGTMGPPEPGFMEGGMDFKVHKLKGFGNEYGKDIGIGAGVGALAGIPVALLANALTGDSKEKGLRSYLKSALLGALLGGGLGAGGGALYKALGIGEPTMSETPLGAQNKVNQMYTTLLDDARSFGLKRKA